MSFSKLERKVAKQSESWKNRQGHRSDSTFTKECNLPEESATESSNKRKIRE